MQSAKDTFYLALRDRLSALAPGRKVVVDGVERPAILVVENEPVNAAPPLPNVYYLAWGAPRVVAGSGNAGRPLMTMECRVSYRAGAVMAGDVDRGRSLTALDVEFFRLCMPPRTPKPNETFVFWGLPSFDDVAPSAPTGFERAGEANALARTATLTVFFFPEVEA